MFQSRQHEVDAEYVVKIPRQNLAALRYTASILLTFVLVEGSPTVLFHSNDGLMSVFYVHSLIDTDQIVHFRPRKPHIMAAFEHTLYCS